MFLGLYRGRVRHVDKEGAMGRMIKQAAGVLVALTLTAPHAQAASAPPANANWVLVKATTPSVSRITGNFTVSGRRTGKGPLVVGVGVSVRGGPYPYNVVYVNRLSGGSPTVGFTVGPASRTVRVTELEHGGGFVIPHAFEYEATLVALMVFVVNGVIESMEFNPASSGVPVSTSVRWGTDAAAVMVAAPTHGVGVEAATAGAGAGIYSRTVPAGIAGAIEGMSCQACVGAWTPPGGKAHTWVYLRLPVCLYYICPYPSTYGFGGEFAGPAGLWKWRAAALAASDHGAVLVDGPGVLLAEPVLAAYAPIGADWTLFTPCQSPVECLGI
jgi:hypothetical protein